MAHRKHSPEATVLSAKQQILNRLCAAYRRSNHNGLIPADALRRELDISEAVFVEAVNSFIIGENQEAVEVFENKGRSSLRLGESMRDLCSDWRPIEKRDQVSKTEPIVAVSAYGSLRRSA